ncbi:uncharacterized protein LOC111627367 [Centruroides sculpturatus]|uniref:uncharacterized protein LOC111627367 n=1 Tax=Centruroides sculpturatus TaxID=218467 RepID=UPI000C6E63AF|nr:uncharacterized protein LOC111627367 [Centruroides sculpturatus]
MSFKGRERSGRPESDRDSDHSSQDGAFDKKIQSSRLYIGFLSDRVTKADLEEKFSKYGRVSGVSMQKGFAFLQFGHEDEATEAIKQENGAMFKGNRIEVAHAFESKRRSGRGGRRSSPIGDRNFRDRGRDFAHDSHKDGRDRSLIRGDDRFRDNYRKDDRYQRKDVKDDSRNFDSGRDYFRRKYEDTYYRDRRDNLRDPGSDILHSYYKDLVLDPKRPNDCEIIVVDKAYRLYAESVERRLVNLGMLVDMVFPKDGAFVSQIVDDITRRGSLFAIVISQQHEAHNSVTLNLLQGNPQDNDQSVALKQQELQQKIFSIIGQTPTPTAENINLGLKAQATVGQSTGIGQSLDIQQRQTSQQSSTYINFDNPNVKKALDNLIQTGPKLLESIGMTSAGSQDASSALIQSPNLLRGSLGGQMTSGAGAGMANLGSMGSMGMQNDYTGTLNSPNLGLNKNIGYSDQLGMSSQTNQLMGTNLGSQMRGNTGMNPDRSFGLTGSLQQTANLNKNLGTQFHNAGINMERNLNLSSSLSQGTSGGGNRNLGTNLSNTRGSNINSQGSRPNAPNNNFQNNSNLMRGVSGARHPLLGTQMGNQSLHGRGGRF